MNLEKLNKNQLAAVTCDLGQTLIIAGAGSGKTTVLTNRFEYIINNYGFSPDEIVAITFTNKSSNEMKLRLKNNLNISYFPWVGTFHSFCSKVIREDGGSINISQNFTIIDFEDQKELLKEIYQQNEIDSKIFKYKDVLNKIRFIKLNSLSTDFTSTEKDWDLLKIRTLSEAITYSKIVPAYFKRCQEANYLDFDDLLLKAVIILEIKEIGLKWANKFKYILVDEFQDTNTIQYELLTIIMQSCQNIFAVGDPDQMIYSWRGADQKIINSFNVDFPKSKIIILEQNYRSTQEILNLSNGLIKHNSNRIHKELVNKTKIGLKPEYFFAFNQKGESKLVVQKIKDLIKKKEDLNEIAILYRSNFISRMIEQELVTAGVPYKIFGNLKFYERKEIKDAIGYLKAIFLKDGLSIKRIINFPRRGISNPTIQKLITLATQNDISLYESLLRASECDITIRAKESIKNFITFLTFNYSNLSIIESFDYIMQITNFKDAFTPEDSERLENLDELRNSILEYQKNHPTGIIAEYLQEISLFTDTNKQEFNGIQLMTIHTAKGLEFENVFLIGFNEGIIPSNQALKSSQGLEEERRIAYVGITRAKKFLSISSFGGWNFISSQQNKKSRFIDEIKPEHFEIKYRESLLREDYPNFDKKIFLTPKYGNENISFKIGDTIEHKVFGNGIVMGINDPYIEVLFKKPFLNKTLLKNHSAIIKL